MSLKTRLGALVYDWPRFERTMRGRGPHPWIAMRNRSERLTLDGRGARCEWLYTSELHIANVFPSTGRRLMKRAFTDWPIVFRDTLEVSNTPEVSFIIGHRGVDRLPLLHETLRSIAGQRDASIECIVVEQSVQREASLPVWVRHLHTPNDGPYNRAAAFNAGAREARGRLLILHDNDMLCPSRYAAEVVDRAAEGWSFLDLKRFLFYYDAHGALATVVQNAQGGSIAASRDAFFDIGGFDESFVGWGGEDNEFWERAETTKRVYTFGYLPFIHLWHPPQPGKQSSDAPAVKRYHELKGIKPEERIERLRNRR